ncbi:MAG TPA: hypothetical protein VGM88_08590 [Kofleriaceae bacterium]
MPDAARAADRDRRALDDISEQLGTVLRTADDLLADWARFGTQVRAQVERDAEAIGDAVAQAAERAAGSGVERVIAERLGALSTELGRLEQRARAAARAQSEQRTGDRKLIVGGLAGIALANVLLVLMLLRGSSSAPAAAPPTGTAPQAAATAPTSDDGALRANGATVPSGDGSDTATPRGDGANGATRGDGATGTTRGDGAAMPTTLVTNAIHGAANIGRTASPAGAANIGGAAGPASAATDDARDEAHDAHDAHDAHEPRGPHGGVVHQGVPVHHPGR